MVLTYDRPFDPSCRVYTDGHMFTFCGGFVMPQLDIFRAQFNYENPSGRAAWTVYYRMTELISGNGPETRRLAQSIVAQFGSQIIDILSDDFWFTSVAVRKVFEVGGVLDQEPPWVENVATQQGTRTGPGLPANNAMIMSLFQGTLPAKNNGRIFLPGIAEGDTDAGLLNTAFLTGPVTAFRNTLSQPIPEDLGGTGEWELGVISQKILNLTPPTKDWANAFLPVTAVALSPIIGTQRRRGTRVVGAVT